MSDTLEAAQGRGSACWNETLPDHGETSINIGALVLNTLSSIEPFLAVYLNGIHRRECFTRTNVTRLSTCSDNDKRVKHSLGHARNIERLVMNDISRVAFICLCKGTTTILKASSDAPSMW